MLRAVQVRLTPGLPCTRNLFKKKFRGCRPAVQGSSAQHSWANKCLKVETFLWQVFLDLDFTLMEMNPFTLDSEGKPFPLDMRGELDDTAAFKSGKK